MCVSVYVCVCPSLPSLVFAVSALIRFIGMTAEGSNDAQNANGIKVCYSPSINFMKEGRSNNHLEQSEGKMRLLEPQMDMSKCDWH